MAVLPPLNDCLTCLYSDDGAVRSSAATYLWAHLILADDSSARDMILRHLVPRIEDPVYDVRFVVINAIYTNCLDSRPVGPERYGLTSRRLARALLAHVGCDDRELPKTCCILLGSLIRTRLVGINAFARIIHLSIMSPERRRDILSGWASCFRGDGEQSDGRGTADSQCAD